MIEINLPEKTRALVEGDIFKLDDSIDDTLLAKFLFYVPTVVREYGLAIAELRRAKREYEKEILMLQSELERTEAEVLLGLDVEVYKNESLRDAGVKDSSKVQELKSRIIEQKKGMLDVESDTDELVEQYWGFKTLKDSLESITKLRVSERSF